MLKHTEKYHLYPHLLKVPQLIQARKDDGLLSRDVEKQSKSMPEFGTTISLTEKVLDLTMGLEKGYAPPVLAAIKIPMSKGAVHRKHSNKKIGRGYSPAYFVLFCLWLATIPFVSWPNLTDDVDSLVTFVFMLGNFLTINHQWLIIDEFRITHHGAVAADDNHFMPSSTLWWWQQQQ